MFYAIALKACMPVSYGTNYHNARPYILLVWPPYSVVNELVFNLVLIMALVKTFFALNAK